MERGRKRDCLVYLSLSVCWVCRGVLQLCGLRATSLETEAMKIQILCVGGYLGVEGKMGMGHQSLSCFCGVFSPFQEQPWLPPRTGQG